MSVRTIALGVVALSLPLLAVGCGGGEDDSNSGDRPSVEELTEGYTKQLQGKAADELIPQVAGCLATGVHDSELPNGVLRKLSEGEEAKVDEDNEEKYQKILADVENGCVAEATGGGAGG